MAWPQIPGPEISQSREGRVFHSRDLARAGHCVPGTGHIHMFCPSSQPQCLLGGPPHAQRDWTREGTLGTLSSALWVLLQMHEPGGTREKALAAPALPGVAVSRTWAL